MSEEVLEQCRQRLPGLFAEALAQLMRRAHAGDAALGARLERMAPESVSSLLRLEGEGGGELWLSAGSRGLELEARPASAGYGYALAISVAAARHGLWLSERGGADVEEAARALVALASREARELFSKVSFGFEIEITQAPVVGAVHAKVSLGRTALPATPEFKLVMAYDELEDAREQGLSPQQLFLAGKIRIDGDVAKAMLLGMTLAQLS
jgi:putative sterol carrier protein